MQHASGQYTGQGLGKPDLNRVMYGQSLFLSVWSATCTYCKGATLISWEQVQSGQRHWLHLELSYILIFLACVYLLLGGPVMQKILFHTCFAPSSSQFDITLPLVQHKSLQFKSEDMPHLRQSNIGLTTRRSKRHARTETPLKQQEHPSTENNKTEKPKDWVVASVKLRLFRSSLSENFLGNFWAITVSQHSLGVILQLK